MPTNFFQLAYAVDNLETAIQTWLAPLGAGPFFVKNDVLIDSELDRGGAEPLCLRVALGQIGQMQVELIEQVSDGPSAYRDCPPRAPGAVHHIGGLTDDFDRDFARYRDAGVPVAALGRSGPVRFAYLDTRDQLGVLTELIDSATAAGLVTRFGEVEAAARDWDGSNPIRVV